MRGHLTVLLLLALHSPCQETRATLPPTKRVTLTIKDVPVVDALRRLSVASGYHFYFASSKWGDWSDDPKFKALISIDLKDTPALEAFWRLADAAGVKVLLNNDGVNVPSLWWGTHYGTSCHEQFGFRIVNVAEYLWNDFADERRECQLDFVWVAQPDVTVFRAIGIELSEAVDDKGTDLRAPQREVAWREPARHIVLNVAPKAATLIARLRGTVEMEVPGEVVQCTLKQIQQDIIGPIDVGDFRVTGSRTCHADDQMWHIIVEPAKKEAKLEGLAEISARRSAHSTRNSPLISVSEEKGRASFCLQDDPRAPVESISFKIVHSRARIKVPFDFKNIGLQRPK